MTIRVLMLSKACLPATYQSKLSAIGGEADIELSVVVPPSWDDRAGRVQLDRIPAHNYTRYVDPIRWNGRYHLFYFPTAAQRLREIRPHVLHIDEEPYNLATWHALRLGRRAGAKTIFFSWQNLARDYPPPFRQLERHVLRHADQAIVGNAAAVDVWRGKGFAGPIDVIPQFGVDPDVFTPAAPAERRETFVIGAAGRLVPEKGFDLLLRAAAMLDGPWRLEIAGTGPEHDALRRLAEGLGISGRVHFRERVPSAAMPAFLRELDALVLPSRTRPNWMEQFGRILVEAMASGVAVIGADSGEIPNVIGDAGLIVPEDDREALAAALARLRQDSALRRALAARGRERVLARYTQAQIAAQTVAVYRALARRSG